MPCSVNLQIGNRGWGTWKLEESSEALNRSGIQRTADGFMLPIPGSVRMEMSTDKDPQPVLTKLRVQLRLDDGSGTELGLAHDDGFYLGSIGAYDRSTNVQWRGSLAALALIEKRRGNNPPTFRVECFAEGYLLRQPEGQRIQHASEPHRIYNTGTITYPEDAWVAMLRRIGVIGNILVETPIPAEAPVGWEKVWSAVNEAYDNLGRGGSTGWKNTVVSIRYALEKWREIEPEKCGHGWTGPAKAQDKENWTKQERLDASRWFLHHYANYGPHSGAEEWSKPEAVYLLNSFAGLLALRDP
jgi:hypothetical protein